MRLIDADALKADYIRTTTITNTPCCLYVSKEQIDNAPTIEAEPIRYGERIYKEYKPTQGDVIGFYSFECSECGCASWIKEYNYCPYCGARMDKGET